MAEDKEDIKTWSDNIAALAVDVLVDSGLIKKEDFQTASAIVAEEILVRLIMKDYPPMQD